MGLLKETIEEMKENCGGMTGGGMGQGGMMKPTNLLSFLVRRGQSEEEEGMGPEENGSDENPEDVVAMSVPLLIRIMELAREDIKDDATLHHVAKKMIALSTEGEPLTMDRYEEIVDGLELGDHEEDMQGGEEQDY